MPRIRAAVSIGKPPLAVLYEEPDRDWTRWDFRLVKAYELYQDLQTNNGVPIYWDKSDRVYFTAEVSTSKSRAAIERAEEKDSKAKTRTYGKGYYPKAHTHDGGPLPTLNEWLEEQQKLKEMMKERPRAASAYGNENWKPPGDPSID